MNQVIIGLLGQRDVLQRVEPARVQREVLGDGWLTLGLPPSCFDHGVLDVELGHRGPERIGAGFEGAAAAITLPELKPSTKIRTGMTARIPAWPSSFKVVEKPMSQGGQQLCSLTASRVPRGFTEVKRKSSQRQLKFF